MLVKLGGQTLRQIKRRTTFAPKRGWLLQPSSLRGMAFCATDLCQLCEGH